MRPMNKTEYKSQLLVCENNSKNKNWAHNKNLEPQDLLNRERERERCQSASKFEVQLLILDPHSNSVKSWVVYWECGTFNVPLAI